ncbi:hypothetical protein BCEN4_740166 [Burkholderia cenocepacia]|nr:hypothetical protein BCEN4_740166 [Burkholderia cenocepacia]
MFEPTAVAPLSAVVLAPTAVPPTPAVVLAPTAVPFELDPLEAPIAVAPVEVGPPAAALLPIAVPFVPEAPAPEPYSVLPGPAAKAKLTANTLLVSVAIDKAIIVFFMFILSPYGLVLFL